MKKLLVSMLVATTLLVSVACKPSDVVKSKDPQVIRISEKIDDISESICNFGDADIPEYVPEYCYEENTTARSEIDQAVNDLSDCIDIYKTYAKFLGGDDAKEAIQGLEILDYTVQFMGMVAADQYDGGYDSWDYTDPETGYVFRYDGYEDLYYCYITDSRFYQYDNNTGDYYIYDDCAGYYVFNPSRGVITYMDEENNTEVTVNMESGEFFYYDDKTGNQKGYDPKTNKTYSYDAQGNPTGTTYDAYGDILEMGDGQED